MKNRTRPDRRLVVADPDPEHREQTVRGLSGLGYDVVARASTGLETIGATARHRPDLIVVSVTLTGPLDGPGTARAVDEIYGIPAVVVANGHQELGRTADPLPFGLIRKPFGIRELQRTVEEAFRRPTPGGDRVSGPPSRTAAT